MADNFFARAAELSARGEPFVTATVVRAERPTSAKPGDRAIVTAGGELHGALLPHHGEARHAFKAGIGRSHHHVDRVAHHVEGEGTETV